jgi:calpain, invertebrate
VYKLKGDEPDGPLDLAFFKRTVSAAKAPSFIDLREVCGRHKLPPGDYVVMPTTFEPNQEADYLVRLFSEKPQQAAYVCVVL